MKNKILLPVLLIALTMNVTAQKDVTKDVKTKYLSLPAYDISASDPSAITAEFSMGNAIFGTEKMSQGRLYRRGIAGYDRRAEPGDNFP